MSNKAIKACGECLVRAGLHEAENGITESDVKRLHGIDEGNPYGELEALILQADEIWIDFSEWSPSDLNLKTKCKFFGIPKGSVHFGGYLGKEMFLCDTREKQKIAVYLYKWCRNLAKLSTCDQRRFHFLDGICVGDARPYQEEHCALMGAALIGAVLSTATSLH